MDAKDGIKIWDHELEGVPLCLDFSPDQGLTAVAAETGGAVEIILLAADGGVIMRHRTAQRPRSLRIDAALKRVVYLDDCGGLHAVKFSGAVLYDKNLNVLFQDFCRGASGFYLWHGGLGVYKTDSLGGKLQKLAIRTPVAKLICLPRSKLVFVVHDPLLISVCDLKGNHLWYTHNPSPISLGGETDSDLDASATGDKVLISCFEKGVYVYNALERTLRVLEVEETVLHSAVSGDGCSMLVAVAGNILHLVSDRVQTLWRASTHAPVKACRLDAEGKRAMVAFEDGLLACYEFVEKSEERSKFLEIAKSAAHRPETTETAMREVWRRPRAPAPPGGGLLCLSRDGRLFLHGSRKEFLIGDAAGHVFWKKGFLGFFENAALSRNGALAVLHQPEEIFLVDTATRAEKHLVYCPARVHALGVDPLGGGVAVCDNKNAVTFYASDGRKEWSVTPNFVVERVIPNLAARSLALVDKKRHLHFFDLKNMKRLPALFSRPYEILVEGDGALYLHAGQGECLALNANGGILWRANLGKNITGITALRGGVSAWLGEGGEVAVVDGNGKVLGEASLKSSRSQLSHGGEDVLEISVSGTAVACYKLLTGEKLWGARLASAVECFAVSPEGNRMILVDGETLSGWRLGDGPDPAGDRSSFLEF